MSSSQPEPRGPRAPGRGVLIALLGDVQPVGEAGQEGLHDHWVHGQARLQAPEQGEAAQESGECLHLVWV